MRTGYAAIADEFVGITPGTDGLFVFALIQCLLEAGRIDPDFLVRYTSAHYLVIDAPGAADHGLFARDGEGRPLAYDRFAGSLVLAEAPDTDPALLGTYRFADGRSARPAFALAAKRYLAPEYAPEAVAGRCGVPADTIRRIAAEIAEVAFNQPVALEQPWTDTDGRRHATMFGRPVAIHAMRGISAHSNGFHTCRAIHLLQMLIGGVDSPGWFTPGAIFGGWRAMRNAQWDSSGSGAHCRRSRPAAGGLPTPDFGWLPMVRSISLFDRPDKFGGIIDSDASSD